MPIIKVRNNLREDLGILKEAQRDKVEAILRKFMEEIRKLQGEAEARLDRACPERKRKCPTCAFEPATDTWDGFMGTAYNFAWALHHEKHFLCHHDQEGWKDRNFDVSKIAPCMSYVSIRVLFHEEAKALARQALEDIRREVPVAAAA